MWVLLFLVGLVLDALIALYTKAVAKGQASMAAAMTAAVTALNLAVLDQILSGRDWLGALAFIFGGAVGTFCIVRRK